jgi:hypothetical protein
MRYVACVGRKENEPEAIHACSAVELEEQTIN